MFAILIHVVLHCLSKGCQFFFTASSFPSAHDNHLLFSLPFLAGVFLFQVLALISCCKFLSSGWLAQVFTLHLDAITGLLPSMHLYAMVTLHSNWSAAVEGFPIWSNAGKTTDI
jgi:hypothetical protein